MRSIARIIALITGLIGGVLFSQAPELAQQYRQRIGGAIDELRVIVDDFDRQARQNTLDRAEALNLYAISSEQFLKQQGDTMKRTINRYEILEQQQASLASASPVLKPLILLQDADAAILQNTWRDFIPAIPVSLPGLIWGGIGFVTAWYLSGLAALLSRSAYRLGAGRRYRLLYKK
ncbi:DUF2937 family protein [Pararhizobium sp.]|uniref:DUF2937 family protein n=1 Tax=Pararhizobium sp. TaxID=1977563 RepID=UPI0027278AE7|nr:DUF2937 family protein [Pararhizobium sp.]MDO9415622.1 DUF2937 family protein [Pararhizobium sp.]